MLARLVCLFLGHRPWRLMVETMLPPAAVTCAWRYTGHGPGYIEHLRALRRATQGGKTVTVTCDRCGTIRTIEH